MYSRVGSDGDPWTSRTPLPEYCLGIAPMKSHRGAFSLRAFPSMSNCRAVHFTAIGRAGIEPLRLGLEQHRLLMVSEKAQAEVPRAVEAFPRVGPIADHVAQADDFRHPAALNILQHGVERLEVAHGCQKQSPAFLLSTAQQGPLRGKSRTKSRVSPRPQGPGAARAAGHPSGARARTSRTRRRVRVFPTAHGSRDRKDPFLPPAFSGCRPRRRTRRRSSCTSGDPLRDRGRAGTTGRPGGLTRASFIVRSGDVRLFYQRGGGLQRL